MNRKMAVLLGLRRYDTGTSIPAPEPGPLTGLSASPQQVVVDEAGLPVEDPLVDGVITNPNPAIEEDSDAEIEQPGEALPAEDGVATEAADQEVEAAGERGPEPAAEVVAVEDETKP